MDRRSVRIETKIASSEHENETSLGDEKRVWCNINRAEQATYIKAEIDELVADIYRAMRTTYDYHSKRLDDIYYPFNNNISWLTTRTDDMKQDIAMIQEQHAVGGGA